MLDHSECDDRRHEADGGGDHKRLMVSGDYGTCTLRKAVPRDRPSDVDQNRQSHGRSNLLGRADETASGSLIPIGDASWRGHGHAYERKSYADARNPQGGAYARE